MPRIWPFGRNEDRALTKDNVAEAWYSNTTSAGVNVTRSTPFQIPAAMRAIRVIANAVATAQVDIYQVAVDDPEAEAEIDRDHPLNDILSVEATPMLSAFDFKEIISVHLNTHGNFYGKVDFNEANDPVFVTPLPPHEIEVKTNPLRYIFKPTSGDIGDPLTEQVYSPEEILHIKGVSYDGVCGVSPIKAFRTTYGLTKATIDYGANYFEGGGRPQGALNFEDPLTNEQKADASEQWTKFVKDGKVPVFSGGRMAYLPFQIPPEDSQFLATRVENIRDIARIYNVPLSKVSDAESQTYDNVTTEALTFISDTINPFLARVESAFNQMFLAPRRGIDGRFEYEDGVRRFVKFNTQHLMVVDPEQEIDRMVMATGGPVLTVNEARKRLGEEPVDGGDELRDSSAEMMQEAMSGNENPFDQEPEEDNDSDDAG